MTSSFSIGTRSVIPELVDGYTHSRDGRHVFNTVPNTARSVAVVFPASLRNGTMTAVFGSYAEAAELDAMLAGTSPLTFADSDVPAIGMVFLLNGRCSVGQSAARGAWTVTFDFQEVAP